MHPWPRVRTVRPLALDSITHRPCMSLALRCCFLLLVAVHMCTIKQPYTAILLAFAGHRGHAASAHVPDCAPALPLPCEWQPRLSGQGGWVRVRVRVRMLPLRHLSSLALTWFGSLVPGRLPRRRCVGPHRHFTVANPAPHCGTDFLTTMA